jgi:hypothetical protein
MPLLLGAVLGAVLLSVVGVGTMLYHEGASLDSALGRDEIHGAPAPLIGAGFPLVVIVGGAWVGYRFVKRRRQKTVHRSRVA